MATKKSSTNPSTALTLEKLIPMYGKDKAVLDEYKKSTDIANKRIKELMVAENLTEKEVGGYKATYSVSKQELYKDEVLDYMKQNKELKACIRTQEYVDWDVFEELVYAGKIPQAKVAAIKKFQYFKETPKLTVKKVEEKKHGKN